MGERMAAFDWSRTPLGPAESWPQSLRTCVRIILTSSQPMFVWWGDGLINLYNDAYRSIVGGKHPGALGQPASSVWREIWDQVGPRAEASMQRNRGTYDEALLLIMERYGYAVETYYTFSYSPVPDDEGGTGGILCATPTTPLASSARGASPYFASSRREPEMRALARTRVARARARSRPTRATSPSRYST
jgi:hypothetical protein